ncbi:hypothetical protein [Myxococcus phage Mx1]|nr:hypothetical protein [Myxococcus phage Mx1]
MKRTYTKVPFSQEEVRHRVVVESDECIANTQHSRFIQFELLQGVASDPALTACGPSVFQTMKMYHDGSKWVVECEAILARERSAG